MARTSQIQLWNRPLPKLILAGLVLYAFMPLLKKNAYRIEGLKTLVKDQFSGYGQLPKLIDETRESV